MKQLQPSGVDFSHGYRFAQRAAWLMGVVTVVEATQAEVLRELDKTLLYLAEA